MLQIKFIKIYLMVAELHSRNENEVKIWIRGHNLKMEKTELSFLHAILNIDLFYNPAKYN